MDLSMLRLVVAIVVVGLVGRAARPAWRNRGLATAVWRRVRPRHVLGAGTLLCVVIVTMTTLLTAFPFTAWGLGRVIGLSGNALFAPLEEAAARSGGGITTAEGASALGLPVTAGMIAFLLLLLALFPWLAYVEERTFREGLEHATTWSQVRKALTFGLMHLVMLIPLAAALAIALAGYAYGVVYRAAYRRELTRLQAVVAGDRSVDRGVAEAATPLFGLLVLADGAVAGHARAVATLSATVWHTTFNSLIIVLLITGLLMEIL